MSTPDTNNIGIKLQAAGENLNTWGDPNLNNDFIVVSHLTSGWVSITINGDYVVSSNESNYTTTNPSEYATLKLVAGTVAAAFNFTLAARAKRLVLWNATGYTATIKLAATTGFTLPTGRIIIVGTDGSTDAYNMTGNYLGSGFTVTNTYDPTTKTYVDTAIATAALPATSGTVLNSGGDTTAGYLGVKVGAAGSFLTLATANPAGNEVATFTFDEGGMSLYASVMAL